MLSPLVELTTQLFFSLGKIFLPNPMPGMFANEQERQKFFSGHVVGETWQFYKVSCFQDLLVHVCQLIGVPLIFVFKDMLNDLPLVHGKTY